MIFIIVTTAILIYAFLIEPYLLSVTHLNLYFNDLPLSFENIKIAQISDIHFTRFIRLHYKVLDTLVKEKPDITVITGDFVNESLKITCKDFCKSIAEKSKYTLAVPGNWDHKVNDFSYFIKSISETGISLLVNSSTVFSKNGDRIFIAGTDDPYKKYADLKKTFRNIPQDAFVILLAHCPDIIYDATEYKPQLVLSGHTHGGQVKIPFIKALYVPSKFGTRFLCGLFKIKNSYLYVNRGIGTSHLPIRFFSPPEITVITLHSKKSF